MCVCVGGGAAFFNLCLSYTHPRSGHTPGSVVKNRSLLVVLWGLHVVLGFVQGWCFMPRVSKKSQQVKTMLPEGLFFQVFMFTYALYQMLP